jgi:hypothetical protein
MFFFLCGEISAQIGNFKKKKDHVLVANALDGFHCCMLLKMKLAK